MSSLIYMNPPPPFPKFWTVTDPTWNANPGPWNGEELEAMALEFATGIRPILSEYNNWFVIDNEGRTIAESAEEKRG